MRPPGSLPAGIKKRESLTNVRNSQYLPATGIEPVREISPAGF